MANPIPFKPPAVDTRTEQGKRLIAAPTEHAEALLVLWDLLQAAHDEGLLDAAHGLVTAKDTVFASLAEGAKKPEGIAALRNLIAAVKVLGSIDPDVLDKLARAFSEADEEQRREQKPPNLWQLARRVMGEDSRRGMSYVASLLSSLGRALKR